MKRISRFTSLPWARSKVHLGTVPLLTAAAAAAAISIGLGTAATAAADTTSVSTQSNEAGGVASITTQTVQDMQLQIQMKHGENRQYTVVGNIMKTKHNTVKNSISNIR